ncbi:hypothetical protein HGM15179_010687 [Zosterops borbonicus]|uniref:Uncharacterized protein n=1 Tax=Zosterops borbonicus TaxID=364589 RepID=A0A8K1GEB6_9PASS|nr:hypothetical protein HGM15179_010687 [Zosterops borbonicus]
MAWLLEEKEQRGQESSRLSQGPMLLSACQHWWFWSSAKILLMLFQLYWLPRQSSTGSDSSSQGGTSSSAEKEREGEEKGQQGTFSWTVEWICWGDAPTSNARQCAVIPPVSYDELGRSQILLPEQSLHVLPVVLFFMPGGTGRIHLW